MKTIGLAQIFILSTLIACGGSGGGSGESQRQEGSAAEEAVDGIYHAHLRPLNPRSNGFLPHGGATFRVEGDVLTVKTYLDDNASVTHRQSVHVGTRCPDLSDDRNGDRFIDYPEAIAAVGPVLIPLDGDISGQEKGAESYPRGTGFTYTRTSNLSAMLTDLWEVDPVPGDEFVKLNRSEGMRLVGRVVLIHGTYGGAHLPASLQGRGSEVANLSLPVVCGVIAPVP